MQDELITKLNGLIADINSKEIESHIDNNTLQNWLEAWRMEAAMVSMRLFIEIDAKERELNRLRDFEETVYKLLRAGIQE